MTKLSGITSSPLKTGSNLGYNTGMSNDFEIPSSSSSRHPRVKVRQNPPAKEPIPEPEIDLKEDTPVEDSTKDEKKSPYDEAELLEIFDNIIFSGEYSETVDLRGGKLSVTFTTRTGEQTQEIQRILDRSGLNMITTMEQERSLLNLEASLADFNGKNLSMLKPEDKSKFIRGLPAPVIAAVSVALQKFDSKVIAACNEGAENF